MREVSSDLGQPRCCQSGRLALPRSILRMNVDVIFLHDVHHAPTNKQKACLSFSLLSCSRDRCGRYSDPKNTKSDDDLSLKKNFRVGFPLVCTCGSK